jgi:hypothetical protein
MESGLAAVTLDYGCAIDDMIEMSVGKQEQFDLLAASFRTEDETKRRFLAGRALIFGQPSEIELHLAFVCGSEAIHLQINHDKPPQFSMV